MWILLAIISSIAGGSRNVLSKVGINRLNEYATMWAGVFFSFFITAALVILNGLHIYDPDFWKFVAVRVVIDSLAFITFFKALKSESVSFVIPLLSLVPVFSSITSFFINGQTIGAVGFLGIIIVCSGNLLLFSSQMKLEGAVKKDLLKATLLTMITVLGWALVDPIHKEAIDRSTPFTYTFVSQLFFVPFFSLLAFLKGRKDIPKIFTKKNILPFMSLGLLLNIEFYAQLFSLQTGGLTAFVSAIKSTNVGISSILALIFLKEKVSLMKALAIGVSIIGVTILALS